MTTPAGRARVDRFVLPSGTAAGLFRDDRPPARGPLLERAFCPDHWRSVGERSVAVYRDQVVSECCGWSLPPRLVRLDNGYAYLTPRGRLEAAGQLGTLADEAAFAARARGSAA